MGSAGSSESKDRLNVVVIFIGLVVMVLTTFEETYHLRLRGNTKLEAWDKAKVLFRSFVNDTIDYGLDPGMAAQLSNDAKYKCFIKQLTPLEEEIRGAKFAEGN